MKALLLHLVIKVTLEVICVCFGKILSTTFHELFLHSEIYDHEHGCVSSGLRAKPPCPPSPPSTSLRKVLSCPVHVPITLRGAEGAKAAESESLKGPHLVKGILSKVQKQVETQERTKTQWVVTFS